MTRAEAGLLMLCCPLGDETARPLTSAQYRALAARIRESIPPAVPDAELTENDLRRLGCDADSGARIAALLRREERLQDYLADARRRGIAVLTRLSPAYPQRLRAQLGVSAPAALFCVGEAGVLSTRAAALVGSRVLRPLGETFARRVGALAAKEGLTLISGGAAGADRCAQDACLAAGGRVVCVTADSLPADGRAGPLPAGLLLVCESGWEIPFSAQRTRSRNRIIHALAERTFVAQTDCGTGGTWHGTCENLRGGWSPVFVCDDGTDGARDLCGRGATPVRLDALTSLCALSPNQTSLF